MESICGQSSRALLLIIRCQEIFSIQVDDGADIHIVRFIYNLYDQKPNIRKEHVHFMSFGSKY